MKKLILLIFLLFITILNNYGQTLKIFLDSDGASTDSSNAKSYIFYQKKSDTTWLINQFTMYNRRLLIGEFKDPNLSIQHGTFYYYKPEHESDNLPKTDTSTYLSEVGHFFDGKRNGEWIQFCSNGRKFSVENYVEDKLNGISQTYSCEDTVVRIKGYYIDDMKQGEWQVLGNKGQLIHLDFYKNGKIIKQQNIKEPFKSAIPPPNFIEYIKSNLLKNVNETTARVIVTCVITKEGKLTSPSLSGDKLNPAITNEILNLLNNSPLWTPPYDTKQKTVIEGKAFFFINLKNGSIEIKFSEAGNELIHRINN
ncbi:toxin-antitoxin system YwqK family antitoxin [Mucilaginibacter segetis]|uniref:TonB C-terminal domain-containing protein n=1 Tax=Mucilaginibacter segetis TaxID=2793071 RepID=A0A934PQ29_9SPHI|nr:hypothetical protein [Mucilaginibacter segetis]MBK0378014.1 hypothetical protein [Mucilaginibacter segetis]